MYIINRYICIHGHFYQPPRENPWLDEIEIEDSAFPYHDWNERITAECYAPNASSRILGVERRIINIVNNYSKISFNFGPTLLSWLENHNPEVYQSILEADKESQKRFSGHGSAIAQVYNHIIMPLASSRDKRTEVIWGIRDFTYRFDRLPEGMWLSETAVDIETLEVIAEQGIIFTILAPHQAKRIRKFGNDTWTDVNQNSLNIGMPYRCILPSGRTITIFFYDATIASEVAFGNLLENGETFATRLIDSFPRDSHDPRLLSIATDGETYGHHHRFADMALAYALHEIENRNHAKITIFGEYLEKFPPSHEVSIAENTSWSCIHGVKRWGDDCGCRAQYACLITDTSVCIPISLASSSLIYPIKQWNQKWRKPLREAINWLLIELNLTFEREMEGLFHDPWKVRDVYGDLVIHRSYEKILSFFSEHAKKTPSNQEITHCLKLLEMQKNALFMQTSCGWFFDDLAGIETVQVMMYACRAMQLARDVTGLDLETGFLELLKKAESNLPTIGNGSTIYQKYVQTAIFDINRVAFQFAILSLIEGKPDVLPASTYDIFCNSFEQAEAGNIKLATGYALFRSKTTLKESTLMFVALHMGDHNFIGGVRTYSNDTTFEEIRQDIWSAFTKSDLPGMILSIDRHFDFHSYSLWHLFRDGKRKVLYSILKGALYDIEYEYEQLYKRYYPLVSAMKELHISPPKGLEFPIQYTLNNELIHSIQNDDIESDRMQQIIEEINRGQFFPDMKILSVHAENSINHHIRELAQTPQDLNKISHINRLFSLLSSLSLHLDLQVSQNTYYQIGMMMCAGMKNKSESGDKEAQQWITQYTLLGEHLGVSCHL